MIKRKESIPQKPTYISLFSSAGVGCFGFKLEGFDCIVTNELIERRLNIQKFNHKCKYNTGYLLGDITREDIQDKLYKELDFWKRKENIKDVDVVIATPPCQGMSVANHKKHSNEIKRNSLVVESLIIIKKIKPKFFLLENVSAFMKTACTDTDDVVKSIRQAINDNLANEYEIKDKVLNFKNYGSNSSRTRTIVIGVRKDLANHILPEDLFPNYRKEKTLKEVIGHLPKLNIFGEISRTDIYHFFRTYPEYMRVWLQHTPEGKSAFDNERAEWKPHQIVDGKIVLNVNKNGDKYTRQCWDKVAPCIHTRNDQLASQNTVHPRDDRVFSIRELMDIMSIPASFNWTDISQEVLNELPENEKRSSVPYRTSYPKRNCFQNAR